MGTTRKELVAGPGLSRMEVVRKCLASTWSRIQDSLWAQFVVIKRLTSAHLNKVIICLRMLSEASN